MLPLKTPADGKSFRICTNETVLLLPELLQNGVCNSYALWQWLRDLHNEKRRGFGCCGVGGDGGVVMVIAKEFAG